MTQAVPSICVETTSHGDFVSHLTSTPEEFGNFIRSEAARFDKVIKEAGIKGE